MADTALQAPATGATADAAILAAWALRREAYMAFDTMPEAARSENGRSSPAEIAIWERIWSAETTIADTTATGPAAIEAKLWFGLYTNASPEFHKHGAIIHGDLEALEAMGDRLDESTRSIISAIRSLRNMGAVNGAGDTPADGSPLPDAKFWAAHSKWKSLKDQWEANGNQADEAFDRQRGQVTDAFNAMWLTPVRSAYALGAKLDSINFAEVELPEPAGSTTEMLKWDLYRMIMLELAPEAAADRRYAGAAHGEMSA